VEGRARGTLLLLAAGLIAGGSGAWVALSQRTTPPLRTGAPAPGFELPTLGGGLERLDSYRGRVLFVNFWATWCTPCREEAPALQRLHARLQADGFAVLGVSIDEPDAEEKVRSFVQQLGLTFPILLDADQRVYRAYQAYGVPETFLVDRGGRVVERFIGPKNWDDPRYERAIRHLLRAGPGTGPRSRAGATRAAHASGMLRTSQHRVPR
jgi:peroxiredoxin